MSAMPPIASTRAISLAVGGCSIKARSGSPTVLATIRFSNLGIFRLESLPDPTVEVKRVVAELYCERMQLEI